MHAFRALMHHLKEQDPQHTVILVQVENEPGSWGSVRDFSPEAEKLFTAPVPGGPTEGPWPENRPMAATCPPAALGPRSSAPTPTSISTPGPSPAISARWPPPARRSTRCRCTSMPPCAIPLKPGPANTYESGGATDNVLGIWKAAAPAIDLLAPDIYQNDSARYRKVLELYSSAGQRAVGAGNRPGERPHVLRRAGTWGHRLGAVRARLHRLCQRSAGRAAIDRAVVRPSRADLPDAGADHARRCPPEFRGQTPGRRRGAGPGDANDGFR